MSAAEEDRRPAYLQGIMDYLAHTREGYPKFESRGHRDQTIGETTNLTYTNMDNMIH